MAHDAHHGHEHFNCCGQLFHGKPAFDAHKAKVHGAAAAPAHLCAACGTKFPTPDALRAHARAAHPA